MEKSSDPIPVPSAVIIVFISSFDSILSKRDFSTFKILPFRGNIAWNFLSLPCLADPPAESPSTKYISQISGSFDEQSASFPGRELLSRAVLRRVNSRAWRAASLARAAFVHFSIINFAMEGFSSRYPYNFSFTRDSTAPLTSELPNFVLVCPSNCGSATFTETIAVRPSLTSSPDSENFSVFLMILYCCA